MFCQFVSGPAPLTIPLPPGAVATRYRVDRVRTVTGDAGPLPVPGWDLWRIDSEEPFAAEGLVRVAGQTGPPVYTSPDAPTAAANGLGALGMDQPVRAVLIPIRKNADWWQVSEEGRRTHFHPSATRPGHTRIGEPYIGKIHRRLFHSRAFTREYDFLTYFEFRVGDEEAFVQLVNELRDVSVNPEWSYVDREWEIWMRKIG